MRRVERIALADGIAEGLRRFQDKVDGTLEEGFSAVSFWNNRRGSLTVVGALAALKQMAGPRERCMYCVDSAGNDVEHFWPKSQYWGRMFLWENLLLCCTHCGRLKSEEFPLMNGEPLLIDPANDEPWQYLDFDPVTGNIVARFNPDFGGEWPKGRETVKILRLDRREGVANGYKKTFRRLKAFVEELLQREFSNDDVERLRESDDHGLLGWCFIGTGQTVQPFSGFRKAKPQEWAICQRAFASL